MSVNCFMTPFYFLTFKNRIDSSSTLEFCKDSPFSMHQNVQHQFESQETVVTKKNAYFEEHG